MHWTLLWKAGTEDVQEVEPVLIVDAGLVTVEEKSACIISPSTKATTRRGPILRRSASLGFFSTERTKKYTHVVGLSSEKLPGKEPTLQTNTTYPIARRR
jgi:hypothetical protein